MLRSKAKDSINTVANDQNVKKDKNLHYTWWHNNLINLLTLDPSSTVIIFNVMKIIYVHSVLVMKYFINP